MSRVAQLFRPARADSGRPRHQERDPGALRAQGDAYYRAAEQHPSDQRYHEHHREAQRCFALAAMLEGDF